MKKLIIKLFSKRNLLSIIIVFIGILGLFGIPQQIGLTDEQLIIGLLSFLAIEAIIVNIGYLEGLQESVEQIKAKIVDPNLDDLVAPREGRFELKNYINESKEVFIVGISLESFVMSQTSVLSNMILQKCRIQFVLSDPDSNFLSDIDLNMPTYVGEDVLKTNMRAGLARLAQLYRSLTNAQRNRMEVKTYAGIPFFSGVRIQTHGGKPDIIWVSFYSYGGATGERRSLLINSTTSPKTYEFYDNALDRLWMASRLVNLEDYSF